LIAADQSPLAKKWPERSSECPKPTRISIQPHRIKQRLIGDSRLKRPRNSYILLLPDLLNSLIDKRLQEQAS
jgi:hypothetical protein